MKQLVAIAVFVLPLQLWAQSGSEIFLFDMKSKKGEITLSNPRNITNHTGYDNQPSFHSDLPVIYYSSFNEEGRSDIKSYNYKTNKTENVTNTNEREYSPTLTPDKSSLSCIIQRDNNAQDLGKYPLGGGEPTVLISTMVVGYHVWADNSHLAMFVLGEPNTLHYMRLPTKEDTVIATNIGRSLHKIPGERAISFIEKTTDNEWQIKKLNTETMEVSKLADTLSGREDITWTPDGTLLTSDGTKLFYFNGTSWKLIEAIGGKENLKGVTRLAVSADGKKLAVVVSE